MFNNDIIRDTMLCIEKLCEPYTDASENFHIKAKLHWKLVFEDDYLCSKYDMDDIKYCIIKLKEADMIDVDIYGSKNKIAFLDINDITWYGHEFLNNIRDDNIWNDIKKKSGSIAKVSITIIAEIAKELAYAALKSKFNI